MADAEGIPSNPFAASVRLRCVKRMLLAVWLIGCAHDVQARFPSRPEDPTGTLVLQMTKPASDVTVAVNGVLVVEDEHTERVVIAGVPIGTTEVVMAANGGDKAFH